MSDGIETSEPWRLKWLSLCLESVERREHCHTLLPDPISDHVESLVRRSSQLVAGVAFLVHEREVDQGQHRGQ